MSYLLLYVLQSLRGQDSVLHFLIPDLKRSIVSTSLIFAGILSQIFGPKYLTQKFFSGTTPCAGVY